MKKRLHVSKRERYGQQVQQKHERKIQPRREHATNDDESNGCMPVSVVITNDNLVLRSFVSKVLGDVPLEVVLVVLV